MTSRRDPEERMGLSIEAECERAPVSLICQYIEVFSPDAFVEGEDDQGCGGDRGDGSGIEGDVLEGLEVLDQGVGPLGGSPH